MKGALEPGKGEKNSHSTRFEISSFPEGPAMDPNIPREIELQYEGRWIAWDTVLAKVIGDGDSVGQAFDAARAHAEQTGHLIWYHHILPRNSVIVGGF